MLPKKAQNSLFLADADAVQAGKNRTRHKRLNLALFGSQIAVVAVIIGIIVVSYRPPVAASQQQSNLSVLDQDSAPSVDQIVAANVATNVAQLAQLPVQTNVESLSISLAAKAELSQTNDNFLTKPQIVQENTGRPAISSYTAQGGDTVQSVAAKFGISEDTVRWGNNLTSDAIQGGRNLTIAGITGVVYTVKNGDDPAALADKYKADKDRIITYNNLELTGLVAGKQIVIPDGVLPENERPGFHATTRSSSTFLSLRPTVYAGNGYAYGYCTWYAYNRRAELGRPIGSNWGNASSWAAYARAAGFRVDNTPEAGAVFQTSIGITRAGHVGIVEHVNGDGSFVTSEMNYGGWNRITSRTVSVSEVGQYNYIH